LHSSTTPRNAFSGTCSFVAISARVDRLEKIAFAGGAACLVEEAQLSLFLEPQQEEETFLFPV
jgi:hypothetical protein